MRGGGQGAELLQRVGGDPEIVRRILEQEVERGVVDYDSTSRRYSMNGGLPDDVRLALRDLSCDLDAPLFAGVTEAHAARPPAPAP
jgi:hypothetical protein